MKQRKMLSEQQKVAIIEAYLTTGESSRSLGKKHGIDGSTIIYWSNKYKQEVMGQKTKNSKRSKDESTPHSEVNKDLEISRIRKELAKKELTVLVLEKTIEKASALYGEDIKKKYGTK